MLCSFLISFLIIVSVHVAFSLGSDVNAICGFNETDVDLFDCIAIDRNSRAIK